MHVLLLLLLSRLQSELLQLPLHLLHLREERYGRRGGRGAAVL
jgi:hypothetical protein